MTDLGEQPNKLFSRKFTPWSGHRGAEKKLLPANKHPEPVSGSPAGVN